MSTSRKTKKLTYNLKDRGRKLTGQDRSNVDIASMVAHINSSKTQEMVSTGSLFGYYGHQVRQRFGMQPPETAFIGGKPVRLEPAIRTLEVSAKSDGTVTHVEEFLDNDSGEFARRQYLSNVGGFSTAQNYRKQGGKLIVTSYHGFDYVKQPNYATNVGDGVLFDGLFLPDGDDGLPMFDSVNPDELSMSELMLLQSLDNQVLAIYDSIHACMGVMQINNQLLDQNGELLVENQRLMDRQARYAAIRQKRQAEGFDSMAGIARPFDEFEQEANEFLKKELIDRKKTVRDSLSKIDVSKMGLQ